LAHDRIHAACGKQIDAAAFDLVPVTNNAAGDKIKNTPTAELKKQLKAKKRNPTGRKVACDAWLSPSTLNQQISSLDPQVHSSGLRASDRDFLQINWEDYLQLLNWTAQQGIDGVVAKVSPKLATLLASLSWKTLGSRRAPRKSSGKQAERTASLSAPAVILSVDSYEQCV